MKENIDEEIEKVIEEGGEALINIPIEDKGKNIFYTHSEDLTLKNWEKFMQIGLLKTYQKHDNDNKNILEGSIKKMKNFEDNFLKGPDYAEINDTPIYKLCKIMKKINSIEKKRLIKISDNFNKKNAVTSAFGTFLDACDTFSDKYKELSGKLDDLALNYYLIESRMTYKYMKDFHSDEAKKIAEVEQTAQKNIKDSEQKENDLKKEKEAIRSLSESPNDYLKIAIMIFKLFLDDEPNISKNSKEKIKIVLFESEKREFYKIWDFNAENYVRPGYQFKLIDDPRIPYKLDEKDDIQGYYNLNAHDIDVILYLIYRRIIEVLKDKKRCENSKLLRLTQGLLQTRGITKKILDYNERKHKLRKFTNIQVDILYNLLGKYQYIKAFMKLLEKYRDKNSYYIKDDIFSIFSNNFKRICDFCLIYYDFFIVDSLLELSKKLYTVKDDEKRCYICDEIKDHRLFKTETFWENTLTYMINRIKETKLSMDLNLKIKANTLTDSESNEVAVTIFVIFNMFDEKKAAIGIPYKSVQKIISKVFEKYPQNVKELIQSFAIRTYGLQKEK